MEQPAEILTHHDPELRLRRWRVGDAETVHRIVRESLDHLRPWMPWATDDYDRAEALAYVTRAEQAWESGEAYNYAVLAEDRPVGSVSLMRRIGPGGLEIGYWIHRDWTRRGLGRAAAGTLTREAFTLPGIQRVEIHHDANNAASRAIPRSLGFTEAGQRGPLGDAPAEGESGMVVVWRMTRVQYRARPQPTRTTATDSGGR